jgi:anaerobic selenocysteine-containing dehydrogenase
MWFNPGFIHQDDLRPVPATGVPTPPLPAGARFTPRLFGEVPCAALAGDIESGRVRALLAVGGNPLTAFPQADRLRDAFERLEVLAVADILDNDIAALATHVLACAGQFERADMPIGLDRALGAVASVHTAAVVPPAAERKPLWWVLGEVAERLGHSILPDGCSPSDCTDERILTELGNHGRRSLDALRAEPTAVIDAPVAFGWIRRRVAEGRRWNLAPPELVEQLASRLDAEATGALALVAHRTIDTFNSMPDEWNKETRRTATVGLHADDLERIGVWPDQLVRVENEAGRVVARVRVDPLVRPGVATLSHGHRDTNVNCLVSDTTDVDVLTGMPRLSAVPVAIRAQEH